MPGVRGAKERLMTTLPFADLSELQRALDGIVTLHEDGVEVDDPRAFRATLIDRLIRSAIFGDDEVKAASRWLIRNAAPALGAFPASIHDVYIAGGRGEYANATAPAINVRGLTYDVSRAIFRAAQS